ncbi:MAG: hypothetical protein B7O98_01000 [Zestosphaera tikiterensis]|uniref:Polymerase nucleotidyl transferase domain-containing protein n=1 Tax=Zestosphaera tikiterensis TaxID=1973259 RepID=A0A2R7Y917_9CREN|nr:MAG: hypothetical protein B7O98_01000 [Zestosphaera tikiterensis]
MERVVEVRRRLKEEAIRRAKTFSECVKNKLGKVTTMVFGSYARGDFNVWSDIDVLVVVDSVLPKNPLRRLDIVEECLLAVGVVEPIILTINEFMEKLRKKDPAVVEAVDEGIAILDDLELRKQIEEDSRTFN